MGYLRLDGVDDYITTAATNTGTGTYNRIVLDVVLYTDSAKQQCIYGDTAANVRAAAGATTLSVNAAVINAGNLMGQRTTLDITLNTAADFYYFNAGRGYGFWANYPMRCDIYSIKLYNGTTLFAHYDMTTGTVQDQSGNGRHAKLVGGTWVQDGPVGTPGSVSYATRQIICQSGSVAVATKQIVSRSGAVSYANKQTIYQPGTINAATKQAIYAIGSVSYPTLQVIAQGGIAGAISYATRQLIYSAGAAAYPTKQAIFRQGADQHPTRQSVYAADAFLLPTRQSIYRAGTVPAATRQIIFRSGTDVIPVKLEIFRVGSIDLPTLQAIYDELKLIVSRVALLAERSLRIGLLASRELRIELRGDIAAMKKNQNFEMERGESLYIGFTAVGIDDLTSASVLWAMKKSNASAPSLLKDTVNGIEITGAASFTVTLSTEDTESFSPGIYYHEAYVIDAQQHKNPVASGVITLTLGLI